MTWRRAGRQPGVLLVAGVPLEPVVLVAGGGEALAL
ncbi:hypothetical protein J2847_005355 [Azospirillum agricola]|nr:hypothetical protein [Azospirillum agricola]